MKTAHRHSDDSYSVAGLIVHSKPTNLGTVAKRLETLSGVEVHARNEKGKLVITIEEQPGERFIIDRITEINNTDGVISTSLVFSQTEQIDS